MHDLIQAVQSSKKRLMSKIAHTVPVGVELLCGIALPMETKAQRTKPECTRAKPSRPKLEKIWLMPKTAHTDTYRALQAWNFFLA